MILYLDASALVKRYVDEPGSHRVHELIGRSDEIGTSLIGRVEVVAALAKAMRVGALSPDDAEKMMAQFQTDWPDLVAIHTTNAVVELASTYAWEHGLRGFDAVHLASAMVWQIASNRTVSFATYDRQLWQAADTIGLSALPDDLPSVLSSWR
jgi:predicted nucleic acid-binding protein